MTLTRYTSPQAWRRVKSNIYGNEAIDIARDIASVIRDEEVRRGNVESLGVAGLAVQIHRALTEIDWDKKEQA